MQMNVGLHRLAERLESTRGFSDEKQALRDEWAAETEGAVLPALDALTGSLATLARELDAAEAAAGALERLAAAVDALGDAPESAGYVAPYNAALQALERRLADDGPVVDAVNAVIGRVEPAGAEAEAEIERRYREAAEQAAARKEAEERREAEERKRNALAEADAALAVLAGSIPEVEAARAAELAQAA